MRAPERGPAHARSRSVSSDRIAVAAWRCARLVPLPVEAQQVRAAPGYPPNGFMPGRAGGAAPGRDASSRTLR